MRFQWDYEKESANLAKHGVTFLTAATIFENEVIEFVDSREDYGELRMVAIGRVDLEIYRVIYTWRDEETIRIISARPLFDLIESPRFVIAGLVPAIQGPTFAISQASRWIAGTSPAMTEKGWCTST